MRHPILTDLRPEIEDLRINFLRDPSGPGYREWIGFLDRHKVPTVHCERLWTDEIIKNPPPFENLFPRNNTTKKEPQDEEESDDDKLSSTEEDDDRDEEELDEDEDEDGYDGNEEWWISGNENATRKQVHSDQEDDDETDP